MSLLEQDLIAYDPLTDVTRNERRSLLGVSMLGVALVKVPLVPAKFAALGVEFAQINQRTFLALYSLLVVYYLVAFGIYALTDLVASRRLDRIRYAEYMRQKGALTPPTAASFIKDNIYVPPGAVERPGPSPVYSGLASWDAARAAAALRAVFEFALPVAFGLYAVVVLLRFVP